MPKKVFDRLIWENEEKQKFNLIFYREDRDRFTKNDPDLFISVKIRETINQASGCKSIRFIPEAEINKRV